MEIEKVKVKVGAIYKHKKDGMLWRCICISKDNLIFRVVNEQGYPILKYKGKSTRGEPQLKMITHGYVENLEEIQTQKNEKL